METVIIIPTISFIVGGIVSSIISKIISKIISNKTLIVPKQPFNIKNAQATITLLDEMMLTKFRYYLSSYIQPFLEKDQEIEKKIIKKLKDDFYTDMLNVFNKDLMNQFLVVFDQKGIEIYIHQTFLRLLNERDIYHSNTNESNLSQKMLNEIYKG